MGDDFRQELVDLAKKCVEYSPGCKNEEATKQFLVLPFLEFLGYNVKNPSELSPEYSADYKDKFKNRVDYAILQNGEAVIAIECKANGVSLKGDQGQLRSYYHAVKSVKMGIMTNGLNYEFYADADDQNIMDGEPFLKIDLGEIHKGNIVDSAIDGLRDLQKSKFAPANIGAAAKRRRIFLNIIEQLTNLAESPSEQFTKFFLQHAKIKFIHAKAMPEYQGMVRSAFQEFIKNHVLRRLDSPLDVISSKTIVIDEKEVLAERYEERHKFWEGLLSLAKTKTLLHAKCQPATTNWIAAASGKRGVQFSYVIRQHNVQVELYISGQTAESKKIFDALSEKKGEIEPAFGGRLEWQRLNDKASCRVRAVSQVGGYRDPDKWPQVYEWMTDHMLALEKAFRPHITKI